MKKIKVSLFLAILFTSFNVFHEYYLSTTTLKWVPTKKQLQITSRFFLDDVEALMQEKTGKNVIFLPDSNPTEIDAFVKAIEENKILNAKIKVNNALLKDAKALLDLHDSIEGENLNITMTSSIVPEHTVKEHVRKSLKINRF